MDTWAGPCTNQSKSKKMFKIPKMSDEALGLEGGRKGFKRKNMKKKNTKSKKEEVNLGGDDYGDAGGCDAGGGWKLY